MNLYRQLFTVFSAAALLLVFSAVSNAAPIAIDNFSFEADENTDSGGGFAAGDSGDFGGELTAWIKTSGGDSLVAVGCRDIPAGELHPNPPVGGQESQALSLRDESSVLNTTSTAWSSLSAGDRLTLTIALGMRADNAGLDWNENTFFGLTDADADYSTVELGDTIANSSIIANNPATGDQTGGSGAFTDVSFSYTVQASDLTRNGNIGILIYAQGTGGSSSARNQSFFDNVRLDYTRVPEPGSLALFALAAVTASRRRGRKQLSPVSLESTIALGRAQFARS